MDIHAPVIYGDALFKSYRSTDRDDGVWTNNKIVTFDPTGKLLLQTFTPEPSVIQLDELTDVDSATQTVGFVLISDGGNYNGRFLQESDISDFGSYMASDQQLAVSKTLTADEYFTSYNANTGEFTTGTITAPNLQAVTDIGNITIDPIIVNNSSNGFNAHDPGGTKDIWMNILNGVSLTDTSTNMSTVVHFNTIGFQEIVSGNSVRIGPPAVRTGNFIQTLQDKSGEIALTSDLGGIFPGFTSLFVDYGFTDSSTDWNTAFGWGDHSSAGYESQANKDVNNGYAGLDGSGKINPSQLPALAISDTFTVNSQAAMLALIAETGDVAIRLDENKTYILQGDSPADLLDWQELLFPTTAVSSVFGRQGTVTAQAGDYNTGQITETFTKVFLTSTEKSNFNTAFGWGDHAGLYDNYGFFNLKTNGVQRKTVSGGETLDITGGSNITVSYSAGGVVTLAATGLTPLSGTTIERLAATTTPLGVSFWDTDLKLPCYLEGATWYNAAGGII